jgi:molybdenum-dependent DNA-binding transcriptional regulator ModE
MTLTQLNAFVLVARLGSVTAAASALGVSEPAVSQALSALRQHMGDQLITRGPTGMTLTPGGSRLLATASQIVVLGAEAHAAVRAAQGAPEQLRVVASSAIAEFVLSPLTEAFTRRFAGAVEVSAGVASTREWRSWWPTGWPTWRSVPASRTRRAVTRCRWSASRCSATGWSWSPPGSRSCAAARSSGAGWWTRQGWTRTATPGGCWPRCASRTR